MVTAMNMKRQVHKVMVCVLDEREGEMLQPLGATDSSLALPTSRARSTRRPAAAAAAADDHRHHHRRHRRRRHRCRRRRHMEVLVLGAGHDVGRSCVVVTLGDKRVMFDCGMHIGYKDSRRFPDFTKLTPHGGSLTSVIDAVVITHFHLDHCGALPHMTEVLGYDGPIYMTAPTAAICPSLLEDFRHLMTDRRGEPNLYTSEDITACMRKVTNPNPSPSPSPSPNPRPNPNPNPDPNPGHSGRAARAGAREWRPEPRPVLRRARARCRHVPRRQPRCAPPSCH